MDSIETLPPLSPVIYSLLAGWETNSRCRDIIDNLTGREYVIRHTYNSNDTFELPSGKGLLILGADSEDDELSVYKILPTGNFREKKDVIKSVVNAFTKFIVVIDNIEGRRPSTVWKLTIVQKRPVKGFGNVVR